MNNLLFRHKMHFNLRLRFKKCALLLPCVSVVGSSGFSSLWRKQELGLWLQKTLVFLVLVISFPPFGYVFNQLSNNLVKFGPLTSRLQEDSSRHVPCFPALPFSCLPVHVSHLLSLSLHKFGSRKEKDHGGLSDSAHSYPLISLWKASFPCAVCILSLSQLPCWARMGQDVLYLPSGEFEMVDKGAASSLSSPWVLEMLSGRKMMVNLILVSSGVSLSMSFISFYPCFSICTIFS